MATKMYTWANKIIDYKRIFLRFLEFIILPVLDDVCRCSYCHKKIRGANKCIRHTIENHANEIVAILWPSEDYNGHVHYKTRRYDIRGYQVKCNLTTLDLENWKLNVPTVEVGQSPVCMAKKNQHCQNVSKRNYSMIKVMKTLTMKMILVW